MAAAIGRACCGSTAAAASTGVNTCVGASTCWFAGWNVGQAGAASYTTEIRKPHILAGTPEQVRRELDALHARFGIAEFVIDTPTALTSRRLASLTLLAGERPALAA